MPRPWLSPALPGLGSTTQLSLRLEPNAFDLDVVLARNRDLYERDRLQDRCVEHHRSTGWVWLSPFATLGNHARPHPLVTFD